VSGRFRKKPVVIEAVQYNGANADEIAHFAGLAASVRGRTSELFINTLEGLMKVSPSDWVICGIAGEYYPCKDAIFRATYEAADDAEGQLAKLPSKRFEFP